MARDGCNCSNNHNPCATILLLKPPNKSQLRALPAKNFLVGPNLHWPRQLFRAPEALNMFKLVYMNPENHEQQELKSSRPSRCPSLADQLPKRLRTQKFTKTPPEMQDSGA